MTSPSGVDQLWVGHWPKAATDPPLPALAEPPPRHVFVVDTCLRRLAVTTGEAAACGVAPRPPAQVLTGTRAYQFLLEVATGLRSAVPGETNVFGQCKRAWESFRSYGDARAVAALAPIVAQLIRDARRIRGRYLQSIGGVSYGALLRRLIRPGAGERILIVGVGDLARALVPFFRPWELGFWNRHAPGALFAASGRIFAPDEGAVAAGWAHHVAMATPADEGNDGRWRGWLAHATAARTLVHLGRRRGSRWSWPAHIAAYDLDDLFDLRQSQANVRSLQIERARLACAEQAGLLTAAPARTRRRCALG
jgi:hypothetical protein